MGQQMFNPVDFQFEWTPVASGTGSTGWYRWDAVRGHLEAKRARDEAARRLRREGHRVRSFRLANQVISRGGVGTKYPHIDFVVVVYGLSYRGRWQRRMWYYHLLRLDGGLDDGDTEDD